MNEWVLVGLVAMGTVVVAGWRQLYGEGTQRRLRKKLRVARSL